MAKSDSPSSERAELPLATGDLVDRRFRIEKLLAEGGMGVVYVATDLVRGDRVALKCLSVITAEMAELVARFERELELAARLKSPYTTRVIRSGLLPSGSPYLAMELLEGEDLSRVLKSGRKLPIPVAVDCILEVCDAIDEMHGFGMVHRDLKPSNLFVSQGPDGRTVMKLLDFGLAKMVDDAATPELRMTLTSELLGTPAYMSPEQVKSSGEVDARTDVWSLGVILFELLTGKVPFGSSPIGNVLMAIVQESPPSIASLRKDVPAELEAIVDKCLTKPLAYRFQSVRELARALSPLGTGDIVVHSAGAPRNRDPMATVPELDGSVHTGGPWQALGIDSTDEAPDTRRDAHDAPTIAGGGKRPKT
ncbi:MAG: serine/threonine-protein kinase [Polyangiaceae bacterium]